MTKSEFVVTEGDGSSPGQSFFKRNKKILIIAGVGLAVVAVTLAIVLPLTLKSKANVQGENNATTIKTTVVPVTTTTTTATTTTTTTTIAAPIEKPDSRVDCLPWAKTWSADKVEAECAKNSKCKYQIVPGNKDIPACYYDTSKTKIKLLSQTVSSTGRSYQLQLDQADSTSVVKLEIHELEETVLRFKIYKENEANYEVPFKLYEPIRREITDPKYEIVISTNVNDFSLKVLRKSTGTVLWDTSLGPIIFDDLHRQISTVLPTKNVYGLGENKHKSFRHQLNYQNWPVWARDEGPENYDNGNLYGSQPFYTCMENDGKSHGVLLYNSNAFEYELIPNPGLVYRLTGGIFDFYVFLGPEPENVVQQFTQYVGRTFMPPYWALGFQISRYGYKDLADMKAVLERFQLHDIPLDTQVADIDHYDERKDFTIDEEKWKELPEYFEYLHSIGMKTVMIVDPALIVNETDYWPFETGKENNVFITWPGTNPDYADTNSSIMVGYCWPKGKVAYPDYFKKSTQKWWIESIERHYEKLKFDGLWIDMNEPAVFGTNEERPFNWPEDAKPYWSLKCPDDKYELVKTKASYLYKDTNKLSDKTLCMTAVQGENNEYKHFDVHNLYGFSESIPTFEAARKIAGTRGFSITRSTFIGSGKYGGHWTGDNHSLWSHLYYSIIGMLEFNLFGISYVGADICGFFLDTNKELCARWSQLGAFYPFSRNHNSIGNIDQDPGSLGEPVISATRKALDIRYEILPYYYTLFYKSHSFGNTVIRPLFHEYPSDNQTYAIDKQFLVGPALMVTPVLEEGKRSVSGYFPLDEWYNFYDGMRVASMKPTWMETYAPIDYIPLHVRGGHIIPTQDPALTTEFTRKNPLGLIVAPNEYGEAQGDLFYDDGLSQDIYDKYFFATFSLRENKLKMNIEHNTYDGMATLRMGKVKLFTALWAGVDFSKMTFYLNKYTKLTPSQIIVTPNEVLLHHLDIEMTTDFEIEWSMDAQKFKVAGIDEFEATMQPTIDCALQNDPISQEDCENKGCQYNANNTGAPKCFIPPTVGGYLIESISGSEYTLKKADSFQLFKDDSQNLVFKITRGIINGQSKMTRIMIFDMNVPRYEVPISLNYDERTDIQHLTVNVPDLSRKGKSEREDLFSFEVLNEDGVSIFSTKNAEHGFVYADQFIQIVMNFNYQNLYGFGENTHHSLKHDFDHSNWWGVFARDQPSGGKVTNSYGTHPFLMAINKFTGRAFGMLILNSNAQEYGFIPYNSFSYRTLGGLLDIYMMEEATPELLIQAYTQLIGRPYLPPYWSLGFQLSRYGYNSLEKLKAAVTRTLDAKIPLDIQYADIDHFRKQLDFTYDEVNFKGLPEYIDELKTKGVRFIIILDPAINSEEPNYQPFLEGTKEDVWIKWPASNINPQWDEIQGNNPYMVGYVWPEGKTVFPDFFKNSTKDWWHKQILDHYRNTLKFDGLWIDMNEPANFDTNEEKPWNWPASRPPWNLICPENRLDDPPYLPIIARLYGNHKRISDKTLCMIGRQGEWWKEYNHYDVHNLYGWSQTEPTLRALRSATGKRGIVITRSTYVSSGAYAGHWLGDNNSLWDHLKYNIIGMIEANLFGIPYIGADICGFFGDTTKEMCTRWMQLGAFNTFFRNHNGFNGIDQDPAALGPDVAAASKAIVELRYSLLPYLYSLFYRVSQNGGTVIRSLGHEFSTDPRALDIDRQLMWGSEILVSPVLDRNKRSVYAYFPRNERWFSFYDGREVAEVGRVHELDAPLDFIPIHVRGGSIIVTQEPAINTDLSRKNPFGLIIAPSAKSNDSALNIETELYWDDGDSIDPSRSATKLSFNYLFFNRDHTIAVSVIENNFPLLETNKLATIRLFDVESEPTVISISDLETQSTHRDFFYNSETKELKIRNLAINLQPKSGGVVINIKL